jgi:hypothetical protein
MFQRKQLFGAALLLAAIAMSSHDAHAWALPRSFRIPANIKDPVSPPPYKAPAEDGWMRRTTVGTDALRRAITLAVQRVTAQ